MKVVVTLTGCIAAILFLSSCGGERHITYFEGQQFDTAKLSQIKVPEPIIQKGDLLSIVVFSDNPRATALYNQPISTGSETASPTGDFNGISGIPHSGSAGYLVNSEGNIQFQGLGILHIAGLNKAQLTELLDSKLKDSLLTNPYYNIRFLNYKVTLIGDVSRPGVYSIPTERVSILEAIGLAGDLTFFGKRENILIIREHNDKREFGTIDLTKPEAISSPYYYLRQNDIIIVNADKKKIAANDQTTVRNISIATSIVSAVGIIITIITR
jgi:polysaccharide export outer membrane protein